MSNRLFVALAILILLGCITIGGLLMLWGGIPDLLVRVGFPQSPAKCQPPAKPGVTVISPGVALTWDESTCQYLASFVPTATPVVIATRPMPTVAPTKEPTKAPATVKASTPKTNGTTVNFKGFTVQSTQQQGGWTVSKFERLSDNPIVVGWISRLKDPAPSRWKTFPNVPNADVPEFRVVTCDANPSKKCVPDGMEFGTYSTPYCWQSPCDIPVGAWEYRYITGDYKFQSMECKGDKSKGCMLILVNVMDQSYTWRNEYVDNGFTLRGRYFNGDALEWGLWGLVSQGSASMLNMPTVGLPGEMLNSGQPGNSGANCGVPTGCKSVDVTVVVHAGDALLAVLKTTVSR